MYFYIYFWLLSAFSDLWSEKMSKTLTVEHIKRTLIYSTFNNIVHKCCFSS